MTSSGKLSLRRRELLAAFGVSMMPRALLAADMARLVVGGGALTEIVVALGAGAQIVGVDTTSLYPARLVEKLPKIGYLRTLSAEGILSLSPSMLVVSDQAGPPSVLDQLRSVKLPLAVVPETSAADHVSEKVVAVAEAIGRREKGAEMAATIVADLKAARDAISSLKRPSVLFILSSTGDRLMAAGQATAAETMIDLAGARNAVQGYVNYKPLSSESAMAADPDVIVLPDHAVSALGGAAAVKRLPQLASTRAAAAGRIVSMDSLYLLGLGPRIAHAARDFAAALHPEARLPDLPVRAWTTA
ncbi:MAG: hemin ABC transporter substrate-binding protein [Alphaproteobacteria bacterium]|nr:hemin ABC transporter substrate-binding protein [Alphaproteobacteria bacterium]